MRRLLKVFLLVVVLAVPALGIGFFAGLLPSSVNDPIDKIVNWATGKSAEIRQIVLAAAKPATVREFDNVTTEDPEDEGNIRYFKEKHDKLDNETDIAHLGLNDDLIYPGSLIQGKEVNDFVYIPITSLPRASITLSASLEGSSKTGTSITERVEEPRLSTVRQGIANLLKNAMGPETKAAARADFQYSQVFNKSQTKAVLKAAVSYGAGSLETGFEWNRSKSKTRIVAKYQQVYLTVDVDTPGSPADFFRSDTPIADIRQAIPAGSMPLYVSSVSYGMMALMFIESDESSESVASAIKAHYDSGVVEGNIDASLSSKRVLNSAKFKILVYGGSTAGLKSIEFGYDGFLKVISAGTTYGPDSPGVPIAYRFRSLLDNSLTAVAFTSQYTILKPVRLKQAVKLHVPFVNCTMSNDDTTGGGVADIDRFLIYVTGFDAPRNGDLVQIQPTTCIWQLDTGGGEKDANVGENWSVDRSTTIIFNTDPEKFDFNNAILQIYAKARDWDGKLASDDWGEGTLKLTGRQLQEKAENKFEIRCNDFAFDVSVMATFVD